MSILSSREFGDGFPVLIVHGWQMNSAVEALDFEPIFSGTALRRIYVDLPGMGATPAGDIRNMDDIYRHLVEFVDLRLSKARFLLVGSSCGGYLVRALAHRYAEQVDGLLLRVPLVEPNKRDLDPFTTLISDEEVMSSIPPKDKALLGNIPIQTRSYIKTLKAKYKEAYVPAIESADNEVLGPIRADPQRYQLSFNPHTEFPAPTLIICGRQDETVGYRDALQLLQFYPRSTFTILDRGTHALPIDEVNVFAALVRDWILRVDEWRTRKDN